MRKKYYPKFIILLTIFLSGSLLISMAQTSETQNSAIPTLGYKIINTYPHDRNAFTQGLVFEKGFLYEGTGIRGRSELRKVKAETGEILQTHKLPDQFFGEGITVCGDKIIQLTWQSHQGFVYDRESFELLAEFTYSGEGWGITYDGQRLIMSDGTPVLRFLNPETFEQEGEIEVRDDKGPVSRLNELEYAGGEIYANVWRTERIARISPRTGRVTGWLEPDGLLNFQDIAQPVDVLNGIAYDSEKKRLFITGKLWPKLFEICLICQ